MPWYSYESVEEMALPDDCQLVGVELTPDAIALPSFRHPMKASYVLGPEGGSLSPEMIRRCEYVVKIPMDFCINVAMAGVVVMYDRMHSMGRFAERPVGTGAPYSELEAHQHGKKLYSGGQRLP